MGPRNSPGGLPADRLVVIERVFPAPRALVFKPWTELEHLVRWWGPRGFTAPSCEMDVRPGAAYRACIRLAEDRDHWMQGVYREVAPPERLVFSFAWGDEPGHATLVTVTFAEAGAGRGSLSSRRRSGRPPTATRAATAGPRRSTTSRSTWRVAART